MCISREEYNAVNQTKVFQEITHVQKKHFTTCLKDLIVFFTWDPKRPDSIQWQW